MFPISHQQHEILMGINGWTLPRENLPSVLAPQSQVKHFFLFDGASTSFYFCAADENSKFIRLVYRECIFSYA